MAGGTGVETLVEEEDIDGAVEWVEFKVVVVAVEAMDAISQQAQNDLSTRSLGMG